MAEPLTACGLSYDVVPCRWSHFLQERERTGSLVHRAVSEGRQIYRHGARQIRAA